MTVLRNASEYDDGSIKAKSGLMVGLGETNEEVSENAS